jgi:WD40 repeat protein
VPKISDFGLAKNLDNDARLTQTGHVMGTPNYMAPEQVRGRNDLVGPVTDVYALGAILYELLTGRPPFQAATALEVMKQVSDHDPLAPSRLLPGVPRDLEVICLKCLEKEPVRRYGSAEALADDLHRFRRGEPIRARRVRSLERAWRWARRRPAVAGLLLALVVALLSGTGLSTYFALEASHRAEQAEWQEHQASEARDLAKKLQEKSAQQSAELLLDRGLKSIDEGKVPEALHWMLASLQASPDPEFQRLVRTHLASWGARVPTLVHWLDTPRWETAFSPDGRLFVTAGKLGPGQGQERIHLQFWNLADGRPLGKPIPTEDLGVRGLAFSPDGQTLLGGNSAIQKYQGQPGWATRWDVAGRRLVGKSFGHRNCVIIVAWTTDGQRFMTGSHDGTVIVWDAATGRPLGEPLRHPGAVFQLACSSDSRWLLAASEEAVSLWEIATGQLVGAPLRPEGGKVQSVAFRADGQSFLVGIRLPDKAHRLLVQHWNPIERSLLGTPQTVPHPNGDLAVVDDGRVLAAHDVSPDGRWLREYADGIQLWRLPRDRSSPLEELLPPGEADRKADRDRLPAVFTPATSRVWIPLGGTRPGQAQAWDTATGWPTGAPVACARIFGTARLAASSNGRLVATVSSGTCPGPGDWVQVWHADTGRPAGSALRQPNAVLTLAFSPDGKTLATGGHFHDVHLWDVATGKLLGTPLPQQDIILDLAFDPDGQSLAVGTYGPEVRVWDLPKRRLRLPPLTVDEPVHRVRYSPEGTRLAALCSGAAHLWDAGTGRKIATLQSAKPAEERSWFDLHLLFSPKGDVVLTSSGYSSFRLWSAVTGQPLGPPTPLGQVQRSCFAFSSDGRLVVAGHEDGTAQVWDVAVSRPLGAPVVQALSVIGVTFDADSRSFLTVDADGALRHWPVPSPLQGSVERLTLAVQLSTGLRLDEGRAVVPLTRAEWDDLRRLWREREGAADWTIAAPAGDEAWHEARASDAEQSGQSFTARWHLNHLIAQRPQDWRLYARRGHTYLLEGNKELADTDDRRAAKGASPEQVEAWYHAQALLAPLRRQESTADWYRSRLRQIPSKEP